MPRKGPSTIGSDIFDPDRLLTDAELHQNIHEALNKNDLRTAIIRAFGLPDGDSYEYRAMTSVSLRQVQNAVNAGPLNGLHAWYSKNEEEEDDVGGGSVSTYSVHPPRDEIMAYIKLFDPSKSCANLLKGFKANAKKNSFQASVATHLCSKRYLDGSIAVPRSKKGHLNIYSDFWAWSCLSLQWAGPDEDSARSHTSHPTLVVAMHHFGCVCPSYESLEVVKAVSRGKTVLDVGSGNGYWTYMLRRQGCDVLAIDNGQSDWRTLWIGDTIKEDGARYVQKRPRPETDILLLVYPVVGLDFTTSILNAYKGDVICVAGTQNGNGYTAFKNETIDTWMARERPEFGKVAQLPLPSFAGKDDALFVWRREKTPADIT